MFGLAGRLEEAIRVESMRGSLQSGYLGACRTHGIDELAEVALGHLFRLDPQNSGHSVLVLNLHANRVRVIQIRDTMKEDNRL